MTTAPDALPERVRARVIAFAADSLGVLAPDQVPGPLKRAARFAPQRRARLAGIQIMDQLLEDGDFRERVGVQAKARQPDAAAELAAREPTAAAAALAYLLGSDGWEELVAEAAADDATTDATGRLEAEVITLRARLDTVTAEHSALKRSAKEALAAAKTEVAELRRKLGEARNQARAARIEAERTTADAAERLAQLEASAASADTELRRLRAQVAAAEAEAARAVRTTRTARDEATLRARLLLDTLQQAAHGLRQELALPVVEGAPADRVEADLAEDGTRTSSASASRPADDPELVRELLALPKVHLVVDGYNVTRAEWDDTTLEAQRVRLLRGLGPLAARSGAEITVVFDGTNAESRPVVQHPRGVRVLFSPRGVLADDVIRDLVAAEPPGRPVAVVTSDREVVRDVLARPGVRVVGSRALVRLLG